jgi:hypothetical protein
MENYAFTSSISWPVVILQTGLNVIGFIGASFSLYLCFKNENLKTMRQFSLFLSLLLSILLVHATNFGFALQMSYQQSWKILSNLTLCKLETVVSSYFAIMEIFSLFCIAVDRYLIIVREVVPSKKAMVLSVVMGWTGIGIMSILPVFQPEY